MWKPLVLAIVANTALISLSEAQSCKEKHEIYSACSNLICRPLNCSQVGFPKPCPFPPDYEPSYCTGGIPACICEKGYARNSRGKCIPIKKCPSCGGDKRAEYGCGLNIGRRCSDLNKTETVACNETCKENGCDCRKGYVLDENTGMCVRPRDCTPTCGKDEVYSSCTQGDCAPKTCSELGYPIPCPRIDPKYCIKGCLCKEGYVRAENGTCIPKEQCPPTCGENEVYSDCMQNVCQLKTCLESGYPFGCHQVDPEYCTKGCLCKEGYVRDANGTCIPKEQCPAISCPENEVKTSCANGGCGKWNCSQLGEPDLCSDPYICLIGCICKDGYLRAENGTCVPKDQCPAPPCGTNEHFEFCRDSACEPQCPIVQVTCPPPSGSGTCSAEPACICDCGFVRNDEWNCVPEEECPPPCGQDEVYSACTQATCEPQTCLESFFPLGCPRTIYDCVKGCLCREGYVRNANGTCIPKDKCPRISCPENEVRTSCVNGGCSKQNCSQLKQPDICADPYICLIGCICKEGYLRANNGTCIPMTQCPGYCPENEIFDSCPPTCPPQTCESINKTYECPLMTVEDCVPACKCMDGYFRNKRGQCISKDECSPPCGKNEHYEFCPDSVSEPQTCSQLAYPVTNGYSTCSAEPACICDYGFVRNDEGTCIPKEECPPSCGLNERMEECPPWLCRPQYCSEVGYPITCPAYQGDTTVNPTCPGSPGCVCIDGFARNDYGECVPVDQCPSCGGDNNATQGCGVNCGRLCSNYKEENVICPLRPCFFNGCDCREGYVYDSNIGKCVLPKDCTLQCTKPYEVYNPCPRTCPPQTCYAITLGVIYDCAPPPEGEEFCHAACVCEDGYYRNSADECVSKEDCYDCGKHAHFSCGPECDNECSRLSTWNQTNCPIKNIQCVEKCYCDEGYARDDNKICIPIDLCNVSCNGDANATAGCGTNCGRHCSDYNQEVYACPHYCIVGGCDCKPGYVYDDNLGICVLPENCTPVCRLNEVLDKCSNGGCNRRKCSELIGPVVCKDPEECIVDCVCIAGYLRDEDGVCVPESECKPACQGPNEFYDCGVACDNVCLTLNEQNRTNCPIVNIQCNKMCYCEDGYARNGSNICIPIEDCPPPRCSDDERWEENPCQVCDPLTCAEVGKTKECPPVQNDGCDNTPTCVCKSGLVRNKCGDCVPSSQC